MPGTKSWSLDLPKVLEPGQGPGRIGGHGGWDTSSDILGGFTYKAPDGKTCHGQEAMDMYEMDNPGEGGPHDGITNESGMYWGESQWKPALGQGKFKRLGPDWKRLGIMNGWGDVAASRNSQKIDAYATAGARRLE